MDSLFCVLPEEGRCSTGKSHGEGSNELKRYSQPDGERGFSERQIVGLMDFSRTKTLSLVSDALKTNQTGYL